MKVLLSAYSCLPNAGSEPGIGWNWACAIAAAGHDVVVATRAVNRKTIEAACASQSITNPRFLFHDLPLAVQKVYKLPFGNYIYYCLWQYTVAKKAARSHLQEHFDRVQHITWGSFRLPSFMGRLGIPFIFGPVAGGEDTPKELRSGLGLRGRVWDFLRRLSNSVLTRAPLMSTTYSQATEIVATSRETLQEIPAPFRQKVRVQLAVGIDSESLRSALSARRIPRLTAGQTSLRLLFVGRLLPWKGLHLGLKSLAMLGPDAKDIHFTIVGSGSDESRLKHLARSLGVEDHVTWVPWMNRQKLIQLYSDFDLFLFPSLHDSGGLAVLESMSLGLPVICLDLGGPGISVDNTCGRVISTAGQNEGQVTRAIAQFLRHALADPGLVTRLSHGARRRASALTWEANVRTLYVGNLVPNC